MAKPVSLPEIVITKTVDKPSADLLATLPATPEAPPVPPTTISFPEHAEQVLLGQADHLPDWLLGSS